MSTYVDTNKGEGNNMVDKDNHIYSTSTNSKPKNQLNLEEIDRLAEVAHYGQVDKIGRPYIEHPRAVAELVLLVPSYAELTLGEQWISVATALLHDVLEDTPITNSDLFKHGVIIEVLFSVTAITRKKDISTEDYYLGVNKDKVARVVKVADMAHNADPVRLTLIGDENTRKRLKAKYAKGIKEITKGFPGDEAWFKTRTGLLDMRTSHI